MADLSYLSITQAHDLLTSKQVSVVELTQYYLDRIKQHDPKIKACLTVCDKTALEQAKLVDAKLAKGEEIGMLEGVPYTAKDMFLTRGIRTTAASKMLDGFTAPYNSTAIQRLEDAGAILIAKTNQDEYAHGGSTENSAYHPTHNPWDLDRVPGGSSGGSAAAVAADFGVFSMGTDTGGSIRQPAAYCGVTGLKPTYGVVSRYGVVAMASSFDCIGPITRSAEDAAIVLEVITGVDSRDATTVDLDLSHDNTEKKLKIGVAKEYIDHPTIVEAKNQLSMYDFVEIDLPDGEQALAAYYILVPSEISSNLERYDSLRYGSVAEGVQDLLDRYAKSRGEYFGPEVKRRNLIGTYALSAGYYDAYYNRAMQVRTIIRNSYAEIFKDCDVVIMPTTVAPAFKQGAKNDPLEMYKTDVLTVSANLAGVPAVSIPASLDVDTGLPLGLQIVAAQNNDGLILQIATEFQAATDWHTRRPSL